MANDIPDRAVIGNDEVSPSAIKTQFLRWFDTLFGYFAEHSEGSGDSFAVDSLSGVLNFASKNYSAGSGTVYRVLTPLCEPTDIILITDQGGTNGVGLDIQVYTGTYTSPDSGFTVLVANNATSDKTASLVLNYKIIKNNVS